VDLTAGIKTISFIITKEWLHSVAQTLQDTNIEEFEILISRIQVTDSIGPFYLYINKFIQKSFNISEFDLKPALTIDDIILKVEDTTGDGWDDYLVIDVTFTLNKKLSGLVISVRIDYKFYDLSTESNQSCFYLAERQIQPTLGKQTINISISLSSLFNSFPEAFEAKCFIEISKANGALLDSYYTESYTLSITKPPETESSIYNTKTKKSNIPLISIFVLFVVITLTSRYRKRKR